jgi:ABC-type phosphate transport system permease subunit
LLFTCSIFIATAVTTDPRQAMATLPIVIFSSSESPDAHAQQVAWAAALVLIAVVLIGSIVGRLLSAKTRRQIERAR